MREGKKGRQTLDRGVADTLGPDAEACGGDGGGERKKERTRNHEVGFRGLDIIGEYGG